MLFKKHTVTLKGYGCNDESMARSGSGKRRSARDPEVRFRIETRPPTCAQEEAGRRLFSRLLGRAQSASVAGKVAEQVNGATSTGTVGVGGGRKPPPVKPPSLTNRGALSSSAD